MVLDKKTKDELFLEQLELIDHYIVQKTQLENIIKSGCLHLAKARYIDGRPNYISSLQLPTCDTDKEIKALYSVGFVKESSSNFEEDDKENATQNSTKEETCESSKDSQFQLLKHADVKENPLRWFGVLVSQSLRNAQTDFQKCIELTVHISNIQLKLAQLEKKLKILGQ